MTGESLTSFNLARRLRERIKREGAISFRAWMEAALYDEQEGYYHRSDLARWGRAGDYRTSPERSPLFAATLARYFATLYEELGAPRAWRIVEVGAGAGNFAVVLLATLQRDHPHVFAATHYLIDERSVEARSRAQRWLAPFAQRVTFQSLLDEAGPVEVGVVFSNELLDAMPVHRVINRDGELREMCVGLSAKGEFVWTEQALTSPRLSAHFQDLNISLAEGQIAEVNLDAEDWLARVALALQRGYVITVDYGAEADELYHAPHRRLGTLRAFRQHELSEHVLAQPGAQDLTTTINWTQIKAAGERAGLRTILFARQDEFLIRAGALEQLASMTNEMDSEAEKARLRFSAREMILPGGMSQSFHVLVQKKDDPRFPSPSRLANEPAQEVC